MRVTVLGCGASAGVPLIGCGCPVCRSDNPRNRRTRVSVLVETQGKQLLIDTSPDLRQQSLSVGLTNIDAILFTHNHADHIHGIDDVRSFNHIKGDAIPAYADQETSAMLRQRFPYVFLPKPDSIWFRPCLDLRPIPEEPLGEFEAEGVRVLPFAQWHGAHRTLGFRIGDFAYSTDVNRLEEDALEALAGVRVWIVDCLRYTTSYSHAYYDLTLQWIAQVRPEHAILTHMAHDFDYDTLREQLPRGAEPGYDGMVLQL